MSDNYEYVTTEPAYRVQDIAFGIFSTMIEQEMKSLWYTEPQERKAMVHECFNWAKDFCDECQKWETSEEEKDE